MSDPAASSGRDDIAALLPRDRIEAVSGFGGANHGAGYVYRPSTVDQIREVLDTARHFGVPVAPRGAGRSYGDAAFLAEAVQMDLCRMSRILDWNPASGVITVEPGVTIRDLWRYIIGDGWLPPVVPGTMYPTLGGALAMNIHGKNHFRVGTIGEHTLSFDLLLPGTGEVVTCTPTENAELFFAAIGGFGMLGIFTRMTLQMKRAHTGLLRVRQFAASDLHEMFRITDERIAAGVDYAVGWIDTFAEGGELGRGLVQDATFLAEGEDLNPTQTLRAERQDLSDTLFGVLPKSLLWRFLKPWLNDAGMRFLSGLRYTAGVITSGKSEVDTFAGANFLLDYVPDWKRAYGPGGLIQYQIQIPKETAQSAFSQQLRLCQEQRLFPYLSVFKRHRADDFLMSYAVDGYSLALDFKVTDANRDRLWELAASLDRITVLAGGRFYLAKDSTLHPSRLGSFLAEERVQRFLAIKRRVDPEYLLQTDLWQRLFARAAAS